jgi:hypothetical protein
MRLTLVPPPWTGVQGPAPSPAGSPADARRSGRTTDWNGKCTARGSSPMRSRTLGIGLVLGLVGCDPAEDGDDLAVVDAVATRSADAVSAKANLARLAAVFAGEPELATLTEAEARARAVDLLALRLRGLELADCDPTVVADPVSGTLGADLSDCRVGLLRMDGELQASVAIERSPCAGGMCPSAVVWTLQTFDLEIGAGLFRPRLRGSVTLRDPVDPALPASWSTGDDFVIENRLGTFRTQSTASWTFDGDRCIVGMQLEARLDRVSPADGGDSRIDRAVGTIVVSAQGVDRCPAKCPTAGEVQLAFGRGRVLAWTYDGDELDVIAPGGEHFAASLDCTE